MGTRDKQGILGFVKKIPLFTFVLLFFVQAGLLVSYAISTIISFGQLVSMFLFLTFVCFAILLFLLRKKDFFSAIGIIEFILLLLVPFLMINTLVLNYYISSPVYETTFVIEKNDLFPDIKNDRYIIINNKDVPDEFQSFLHFDAYDYTQPNASFELKIREGIFGYYIIESQQIIYP